MSIAYHGIVASGSGPSITFTRDIPCTTPYQSWMLVLIGQYISPEAAPPVDPVITVTEEDGAQPGPDYCYRTNIWGDPLLSRTMGFSQPSLCNVDAKAQVYGASLLVARGIPAGASMLFDASPNTIAAGNSHWAVMLYSGVEAVFFPFFGSPPGSPRGGVVQQGQVQSNHAACDGSLFVAVDEIPGPDPAATLWLAFAFVSGLYVFVPPTPPLTPSCVTVDPGSPGWDFTTIIDVADSYLAVPYRVCYGHAFGAEPSGNMQFVCLGAPNTLNGGTFVAEGFDGPPYAKPCPPRDVHVAERARFIAA